MAQGKALTAKPEDTSLIPGTHMVEKKNNSSNSDLYIQHGMCPPPNHKINKCNKFFIKKRSYWIISTFVIIKDKCHKAYLL